MTVKLAIFDCDGTLVDSQANIIAAMGDAFDRNGLAPPDEHATRRIVGLSLIEGMQVLLPGADAAFHAVLANDYKNAFHRMRGAGNLAPEPLYPGIADCLLELEARGWLLGVATGKSDRGLALVLAHHGLSGHFVTLQTADRHPSKPHPSMILAAMRDAGVEAAATAMIGDTHFDIEMAVNARVRPIGVDWGYHHPDELLAAGARSVVADVGGLIAALEAV
ncbi:MAG: HAD-IA family hydrolase [Polymorphobacter sp.]